MESWWVLILLGNNVQLFVDKQMCVDWGSLIWEGLGVRIFG